MTSVHFETVDNESMYLYIIRANMVLVGPQAQVFSHMGIEYPFLWPSEIFLSRPACLILGQNCCLKLWSIAMYITSGTTFTISVLGLQCVQSFRTFTVFFMRQKQQEFVQNLIDSHSAKCH